MKRERHKSRGEKVRNSFREDVIDLRRWLGGSYGVGSFDSSRGDGVPGLAAAFQFPQRSGGE